MSLETARDVAGIAGATIVVGAAFIGRCWENAAHGGIFVFTDTDSIWTLEQEIESSEFPPPTSLCSFGNSVAISGTTVVVGGLETWVGENEQQGVAAIFTAP